MVRKYIKVLISAISIWWYIWKIWNQMEWAYYYDSLFIIRIITVQTFYQWNIKNPLLSTVGGEDFKQLLQQRNFLLKWIFLVFSIYLRYQSLEGQLQLIRRLTSIWIFRAKQLRFLNRCCGHFPMHWLQQKFAEIDIY